MPDAPHPDEQLPSTSGWPGLLVAPLASLSALSIGHSLVTPSCGWNSTLALHLVFAVATLVCVLAALLSLRAWRRAGGRALLVDSGGDEGWPVSRDRFVALIGAAAGSYFTLVTCAQWFATALLSPCVY